MSSLWVDPYEIDVSLSLDIYIRKRGKREQVSAGNRQHSKPCGASERVGGVSEQSSWRARGCSTLLRQFHTIPTCRRPDSPTIRVFMVEWARLWGFRRNGREIGNWKLSPKDGRAKRSGEESTPVSVNQRWWHQFQGGKRRSFYGIWILYRRRWMRFLWFCFSSHRL